MGVRKEDKNCDYQRLIEGFNLELDCLRAALASSERIQHCGDRGETNEQHFINFLRHYLPNRYSVEKATVIDSEGQVSESIDIVVFDRQYTPSLFDNDYHRYIPAEAVYAVFECKPEITKEYISYAANKVSSVRKLKRTSTPIYHAGGVMKPKDPGEILGGILALRLSWQDGIESDFCTNALKEHIDYGILNIGLSVEGGCFYSQDKEFVCKNIDTNTPGKHLGIFIFELLDKLQKIGTVPAVDWQKYKGIF